MLLPTLTLGKEKEYLPRETRVILEKNLKTARNNLLVVSNLRFIETKFGKSRLVHFGAEYSYRSRIFIRAGSHSDDTITVGAGLKMRGISLDYVYQGRMPESIVRQNGLSVSVELF